MDLKQQLQADLTAAMRQGDENRKRTLRLTLAEIRNAEVAKIGSLSDEEVMQLLRREVKRRQETIAQLEKAGDRPDYLQAERSELTILEAYLPARLGRDEIAARARQVIDEVGASGPVTMDAVMKRLMPQLKGQADGRLVQEVVRELLASRA